MLCIYGKNKKYNQRTDWLTSPSRRSDSSFFSYSQYAGFYMLPHQLLWNSVCSRNKRRGTSFMYHVEVCGVFLALSEKLLTEQERLHHERRGISKPTLSDSLKSSNICSLLEDKACCLLKPHTGEQTHTADCFPHLFSLSPLSPSLQLSVISWPEEPSSAQSPDFLFPQAQNPHSELPAVLLESHSSSVWGGQVRRLGVSFISETLFGVEK